jgi:hypothetical protein
MTSSKTLIRKFGIASLALFLAIAVYCFARIYPPELLASFQATHPKFAAQTGLFGSAPSFFYTLAIGMLVGASALALSDVRRHCLVWIAVACCLELSQHSFVAEPLASWLAGSLSESTWELIGPYWGRGVFDPLDLLASVLGGSIALLMLTYLSKEYDNENN